MSKQVTITHRPTGTVLARGPLGWGITPFEGNLYIRSKYLAGPYFRSTLIPGLCIYKFLYVWLDLFLPDGSRSPRMAWRYWLPNPLLPFIWFRVAVPGTHPELLIET